MNVTRIVVRAGRTFNHPHEQYSNLQPSVQMEAELAAGEDAMTATKLLQAQAEQLVEDHKQGLLASIEDLYQMSAARSEAMGLERTLRAAQERLTEVRRKWPALAQLELPEKKEPYECAK